MDARSAKKSHATLVIMAFSFLISLAATMVLAGVDSNDGRLPLSRTSLSDVAPLTILTSILPEGAVGEPYFVALEASDESGSVTWSISPYAVGLPAGLEIEGATGVISGIPVEGGTYWFWVNAENQAGEYAQRQLLIAVQGEGVDITSATAPEIKWARLFGGAGDEYVTSTTIDGEGNVYIVGDSESADLTGEPGACFVAKVAPSGEMFWLTWLPYKAWIPKTAFDASGNFLVSGRSVDVSVAKLTPSGELLWQTIFGGTGTELVVGLEVDAEGNSFVIGKTKAADFPTLNAFEERNGGTATNKYDSFAVKLSAAGAVQWSTFLGGTGSNSCYASALTDEGDILLAGHGAVTAFPCPPFDAARADTGSYVAKISADGSPLWAEILSDATAERLVLGPSGGFFTVGVMWGCRNIDPASTAFCIIGECAGLETESVAVAKFSDSGEMLWKGYIGGSDNEFTDCSVVTDDGSLYVAGSSGGHDFPVVNCDDYDAEAGNFMFKVSDSGEMLLSRRIACTGSFLYDRYRTMMTDGGGNVCLVGWTTGHNPLPHGYGPYAFEYNECYCDPWAIFAIKITPSGRIELGSYFAGYEDEAACQAALDADGSLVVVGETRWPDFPVTEGFEDTHGGQRDIFVTKMSTYTKLPGALQGQTYSATLEAAGGVGPCLWRILSGRLPAGVTLDGTSGVMAGLAEEHGRFYVEIEAASGGIEGLCDTRSFVLDVTPSAMVITTDSIANTVCGAQYEQAFEAQGGALPYTWEMTSGELPAGLSLSSSTGVISGESSEYGRFDFVVRVSDSQAEPFTARRAYALYVHSGVFEVETPAEGTAGTEYSVVLSANGGFEPYTWSIIQGNLPSGLTLDAHTGTISGVPGESGTWTLTLQTVDAAGFVCVQEITISIAAATGSAYSWGSYLGGSDNEYFRAMAMDVDGSVCLAGWTDSTDFPVYDGGDGSSGETGDAVRPDAFVAKFAADGKIQWSKVIGGQRRDTAEAVTFDYAGNVIIVGDTASADFPVSNASQNELAGGAGISDAFVMKIAPDGTVMWATYLGGTSTDRGYGVATDSAGNIAVCGYTYSTDFPRTGALAETFGGESDAFVTLFRADGRRLWSGVFGGSGGEILRHVKFDTAGNVVMVGSTSSQDLPVMKAFQGRYGGSGQSGSDDEAFVGKVSSSGKLLWASYLGGSAEDYAYDFAIDGKGDVVVPGFTLSADFPTKKAFDGTFDETAAGTSDGFITKISSAGRLLWSSFVGGDGDDSVRAVSVDRVGSVFLTGWSDSSNLPLHGGFAPTYMGGGDVMVGEVTSSGRLVWLSMLGGSGSDSGRDIAVDGSGNVYIAGTTQSEDFPATGGLDDIYGGGTADLFALKITPEDEIAWAGFAGGNGHEQYAALEVNMGGDMCIAGATFSGDLPTPGGFQTSYGGMSDAFAMKVDSGYAGAEAIAPEDMAMAEVGHSPVLEYETHGNVRRLCVAFSGSRDFPARPVTRGDGQTVRTLRLSLSTGSGEWTPSPSQWQAIRRTACGNGVLYWRLECRTTGAHGQCTAARRISFDSGDIEGLAVSQPGATVPHAIAGDAIWPTKDALPIFTWTNDTTGMKYFHVDISGDPTMPMKDKKKSLTICRRGTQEDFYRPSSSEWLKIRRLATWQKSKSVPEPVEGVLYWRVRATDAQKALSCASTPVTFAVDAGTYAPDELDLTTVAPVATWTHTGEGIVKYSLEFCADGLFTPSSRETLKVPSKGRPEMFHAFSAKELSILSRFAEKKAVTELYWRVDGEDIQRAFISYSESQSAPAP